MGRLSGRPSDLLRFVADRIEAKADILRGSGASALAGEEGWFDQALNAGRASPEVRLWTNSPSLVATRRLALLPGFDAASRASRARGWPVHLRASGGSTVVHRPGILAVSRLSVMPAAEFDLRSAYRPLLDLLARPLLALGLSPAAGSAPDCLCDGSANLLVGGRKVAGTACRVRSRGGRLALLAHAVLWVEGDLDADLAAVSDFEAALGVGRDYDPRLHATIADLLSGSEAQAENRRATASP